jgi:serine/threonine protein kinase
MAAKPAMVERFRREARSAAKLQHENIVKVYEFGEFNGTFFIAMEFVDGINLLEYIENNGPLDPEETRQIMIQACRALKHAYDQGVVHRDIKPSNFLVTQKNGRMVIKLTDLGLAREASAEDFRVTRSGTTVGTIDYMAPEQARDSGAADTRSDLYALGCTWFHMLANQPPFPEGGLAERIVKHMKEPPPDVREFNPRVSKAFTKVLKRLLEKKPADRYQKPADLLEDLLSLDPIAKPKIRKSKYDLEDSDEVPVRRPRRPSRRANDASSGRIGLSSGRRRPRRGLWIVVSAAMAFLLVAGAAIGIVWALKTPSSDADDHVGPVVAAPPPPAPSLPTQPSPVATPPVKDKNEETTAVKRRLPALYQPRMPIDFQQLRERIDGPWTNYSPVPADAPVLRVTRHQRADSGRTHASIAEACAAVPAGQATVIEIHDNGPLYQSTATLADRKVVIRAARGYRPLIVWDIARTLDERKNAGSKVEPVALFQVDVVQLTLEGIDVVVKSPETGADPLALIAVHEGQLDIQNCTFSIAGKHADGIAWVRFEAQKNEPRRCRLSQCYARGGSLVALQLDAPKAEVLLEKCLVAGGEPALLQVRAGSENPATVRVVRSTLVAANSLLRIQTKPTDEHEPALNWLGWDAVLSRTNDQIGGEMLVLPDKALTRKMRWDAVGCLYAGWQRLLGGSAPIGADSREFINWEVTWNITAGDRALQERFPGAVFNDPSQLAAATYSTANTPLEFASTENPEQVLGCPLAQLPPARDNWVPLTFDRFPIPDGDVLDSATKPEVDSSDDQAFHGARVELTPQFDLGVYLQEMQKAKPLAPRVVLQLIGAGEQKTSPIKIRGSSLVLYFEPPAREDAKPLTLTAKSNGADALVEVENGSLDVINGDLSLPDAGKCPSHILKVYGGELRLFRTRLQAPHQTGVDAYEALISFGGSGAAAVDKAQACLINESVLSSGRTGIHCHGAGARVLLRQSVLVTAGDALRVDPGPLVAGHANIQCAFEQSTLAAKGAVLHLGDVLSTETIAGPVVVQTQDCAFLNPFAEAASRPGVLQYEGEALARGLLVWQGEGDFFDKRISYGIASASNLSAESKNWQSQWPLVWGTCGVRKPPAEMVTSRSFDGKNWVLERLAISFPAASTKRKPGADLGLFGVDKKKTTKPL